MVRKSKMFLKDEAKVASTSRVSGVKCGVVCLVKLLFESNESSVLEELRVRRLAVIQEEI